MCLFPCLQRTEFYITYPFSLNSILSTSEGSFKTAREMSFENSRSNITLPDIFIRSTDTRVEVCPSCVQRSNSVPATITTTSSRTINVQEMLPNKYLQAGTAGNTVFNIRCAFISQFDSVFDCVA